MSAEVRSYYLDTSALMKRYLPAEAGSGWLQGLFGSPANSAFFVSALCSVEVASALAQALRMGRLDSAQCSAARLAFSSHQEYLVIDVDPVIPAAAALVTRHALRAYDAVQLAAALHTRDVCRRLGQPDPTFVCSDGDLLAAAIAEGLAVDDPSAH